ncbi:MAG: hypothetical protein JNK48_23930 [Bryobacterales bacterium]|nr:hypothetical protein [Bryobacterales bacterium]
MPPLLAFLLFLPAEECATCHSVIQRPGETRTIAPYALWQGSMMAHAGVDPFWKAQMSWEIAARPEAKAAIEAKCTRCHTPAEKASEGVNCTVCHQIEAAGLGTKASFTGGFKINREKKIYGPHADPFPMPMQMHTGYEPVESKHVLESAMCGSCHTVITHAPDGREFIEQAPYLEWLASDFAKEGKTCQSCHMPVEPREMYIAHRPMGGPFPPTSPRKPFGLHLLIGGNYLVPRMMAETNAGEAATLQRTSERALENLRKAVRLDARVKWTGGRAVVEVHLENRTGHKLPTAYPSRRMWLEVVAKDAQGKVLFASGREAPKAGQPHRDVIRNEDEAMVWEAVMADAGGAPTHTLLTAAQYGKDNRILPRGFRLGDWPVGPVGVGGDGNFRGGSDTVIYDVAMGAKPARVEVRVWYETIKPEHGSVIAGGESAEMRAFAALYAKHRAAALMSETVVQAP